MTAASSSGWHLMFLRNYFYLYAKCGFTREGRGGMGKEKVKAPMTLTNALSAVCCHKTHLPYFSQCILQKKTPGPTKTNKIIINYEFKSFFAERIKYSVQSKTVKIIKFNWLTTWKKDLLQNWGKKIKIVKYLSENKSFTPDCSQVHTFSLEGETWLNSHVCEDSFVALSSTFRNQQVCEEKYL